MDNVLIVRLVGGSRWGEARLGFSDGYIAVALDGVIPDSVDAACWRSDFSQPAESQERGMENSDHPQSRQTQMSGEGVMGG